LPMSGHPFAFWMVLGFAVVVSILVVLIFWRRDWL